MTGEKVRSFIAIELPPAWRESMGRLAKNLPAAGPSPAKWVAPDSIHLTLKFLGDIPVSRVAPILKALETAVAVAPFRLSLGQPGVFPGVRQCRVAWIGLEGDLDALNRLQQYVETALEALGFPREKKAFTPHLTLARVRDTARPEARAQFGEAFLRNRLEASEPLTVTGLSLMKSRLTPAGAIYSRLGQVDLSG